ncbi:nitroreductase family deazaflavin-dependent oxidoreductase [Promicromonospora soli]
MWVWILWIVVGLVALGLGWFLALVVIMRTKSPRGLAIIRGFNRWANRGALRSAGTPGSSTAVIRHVGRKSGKSYATPIGVYPKDDGFLVYLPYGPDVDWLRNVRSAGTAELLVDGRTHVVGPPQIVGPAEALPYLSASDRRVARLFGVVDFLVLEHVPVSSGGER